MSLFEDMPFPRGQTFYQVSTAGTTTAKANVGAPGQTDRQYEGRDYIHPDVVLATSGSAQGNFVARSDSKVTGDSGAGGGNVQVSNRFVKVRIIRWEGTDLTALTAANVDSGTGVNESSPGQGGLLVKMLASTTDRFGQRSAAVTTAVNQFCYPADEFLPTAGVAKWDMFYIVIRGLANIVTDGSSTAFTTTDAATSFVGSSGTAGSCVPVSYAGATTTLAQSLLTTVGRATVAFANGVAAQIVVDVGAHCCG